MSWEERSKDNLDARVERANLSEDPAGDLAVDEALKNFRMSVHAWSDAAYNRPRTVVLTGKQAVWHGSWRLAAGWALVGVLMVGGVSGGVYEQRQKQEQMRLAAARLAEQQKAIREQQLKEEEEDLLAKVDSDVSRQVPSAMEPLAQLMDDEAK